MQTDASFPPTSATTGLADTIRSPSLAQDTEKQDGARPAPSQRSFWDLGCLCPRTPHASFINLFGSSPPPWILGCLSHSPVAAMLPPLTPDSLGFETSPVLAWLEPLLFYPGPPAIACAPGTQLPPSPTPGAPPPPVSPSLQGVGNTPVGGAAGSGLLWLAGPGAQGTRRTACLVLAS